jgi:hypothetical protein
MRLSHDVLVVAGTNGLGRGSGPKVQRAENIALGLQPCCCGARTTTCFYIDFETFSKHQRHIEVVKRFYNSAEHGPATLISLCGEMIRLFG